MSKTFKDFDSEGRFKGVYLSKYLTDEEKTKVRRFAKLDCDLDNNILVLINNIIKHFKLKNYEKF